PRLKGVLRRHRRQSYWWQTLSLAMQLLPHGLPLTQCGFLVEADLPLRQVLMNSFRAAPVMPVACILQSFIRCCCAFVSATAGALSAASVTATKIYFLIVSSPCR